MVFSNRPLRATVVGRWIAKIFSWVQALEAGNGKTFLEIGVCHDTSIAEDNLDRRTSVGALRTEVDDFRKCGVRATPSWHATPQFEI